MPFLQWHRRRIGVIAMDNRLLLPTYWADIRVHTISLGLSDADAATMVPVVATVTADVEPTKHTVGQCRKPICIPHCRTAHIRYRPHSLHYTKFKSSLNKSTGITMANMTPYAVSWLQSMI